MPKYDIAYTLRIPATITVTAKNASDAKKMVKDLPNRTLVEKIGLAIDYLGIKIIGASKIE